jgi:hypothetical protein
MSQKVFPENKKRKCGQGAPLGRVQHCPQRRHLVMVSCSGSFSNSTNKTNHEKYFVRNGSILSGCKELFSS